MDSVKEICKEVISRESDESNTVPCRACRDLHLIEGFMLTVMFQSL